MAALHPSVRRLGWVSFLNDAASEMIYPMLPAFLATLGATPLTLGALEGFAEATASLVKVFSGRLSDRRVPKKPLIVAGYLVSNLVRPLIAAVTPREDRGHAFGFHQGMDHWGGVVGPLLASGLLLLPWFDPRRVFLFTLVPGVLCVALTLVLAEPTEGGSAPDETRGEVPKPRPLGAPFWRFLAVQSVFSLAATSDTFLLLRAQGLGVPISLIALLWAVHNGIRALFSRWGGRRSDRVGRRRSLITGWVVYAITYAGFALAATPAAAVLLFLFYAGYFAMTDGAEKAFVADLSDATNRGFAFGMSQGTSGVMLLVANLLMGLVWTRFGPEEAFFLCAFASAFAAVLLRFMVPEPSRPARPA